MKLRKDKWETVKLSEVCDKTSNVDIRKQSGKFNYIDIGSINSSAKRISEIQDLDWSIASSRARQIVKKGDTLFSTVRVNLERIAFVDKEIPNAIASTGFTVIRANEKATPEYLFYSTSSPFFIDKLCKLQKGTAYPAVSDRIVFNEEIPLPPLEEQKQIAALFQSIETGMEQVDGQEKNLHLLLQNLINDLISEGSKIRKGKLKKVVFGDISNNISERAEPQNSIGQIFVGLDHIDSREIKIERFGKPDSLIGTKLKVYEGDIIFGKRNAYLRKAAISTFDGICSAHAMVLRANKKSIYKDYLPFFMHSDSFMIRAKEISEGSISPTIKWKNLERQEFNIPEIEEQIKFTQVFKQIEEIRNQLKQQKTTLKNLKQKLLNEILG